MSLAKFTTRDIGTALAAVGAAVPAGKTYTVIGMSLCNKSANAISVDVLVREAGPTDTYLLKGFTIPAGETLFPWGTLGKLVMAPGDMIYVKSSAVASLDAILSYYNEAA